MTFPKGFEAPPTLIAGMRCQLCGRIIDGIGYTLQQLADKHATQCPATKEAMK